MSRHSRDTSDKARSASLVPLKRPRHFHQGPDGAGTDTPPITTTEDTPQPSVQLYTHALESVFAFLTLLELGGAMSVSRPWSNAVVSMRRIESVVPGGTNPSTRTNLSAICRSRLSRHVFELGLFKCDLFSPGDLPLIAFAMPRLSYLRVDLTQMERHTAALVFPIGLTRIHVFTSDSAPAPINNLFRVVSQLPRLSRFSISFDSNIDSRISFAPFQSMAQLTELSVYWFGDKDMSFAQLDEIRTMPNLVTVNVGHPADTDNHAAMRHLLRSPHSLQWKSLGPGQLLTAERAALMVALPSLSCVDACLRDAAPSFLTQLPNLTELNLWLFHAVAEPVQQLAALQGCGGLTSLELHFCKFTSQHMCALLTNLPVLRALTLDNANELESLRCFSRGAITRVLTHLSLQNCMHPQLHSTELDHVHALTELRSLALRNIFVEPLDAFTQHQYSRPYSLLLPKLTKFIYHQMHDNEDDDE